MKGTTQNTLIECTQIHANYIISYSPSAIISVVLHLRYLGDAFHTSAGALQISNPINPSENACCNISSIKINQQPQL
jgi:hypothetical protein